MKRLALTALLVIVSCIVLTGCNNTHARTLDGKDTVEFTLKNKKMNLLGNEEDHTNWMLVSTDGDKYVAYYGFVELDPLGRSDLYRSLDEGTTYECEIHDIISYPPANFPVVKNCTAV